MKALVTGSRGFIGRHLVRLLVGCGRFGEVLGISRRGDASSDVSPGRDVWHWEVAADVTNGPYVERAMGHFRPDFVFHLAGNPNTRLADDDPGGKSLWANNVEGTFNLLANAPARCRFVLASSAAVYGDGALNGSSSKEWDPTCPTSLYAASKVACEALVEAQTRLGKVNGVYPRLVAVVGPGATHGLLPDVVRKLLTGGPALELLGNRPGSSKPFCHVEDAAAALLHLALREDTTGPFNVGPEDCLSVEDVAGTVMRTLATHKPVLWAGAAANWAGDNRRVAVNNGAALGLGWRPRFATSRAAVAEAAAQLGALTCR